MGVLATPVTSSPTEVTEIFVSPVGVADVVKYHLSSLALL